MRIAQIPPPPAEAQRRVETRRVAALWVRNFGLELSFREKGLLNNIPAALILNEAGRSRIYAAGRAIAA